MTGAIAEVDDVNCDEVGPRSSTTLGGSADGVGGAGTTEGDGFLGTEDSEEVLALVAGGAASASGTIDGAAISPAGFTEALALASRASLTAS